MDASGNRRWRLLRLSGLGAGWDLIHQGQTLTANPFGPPAFGQLFFLITGFHGFHVFSGVVINCIVCAMAATGSLERRGHYEMVEKVGLYWHFVDLVWIFVFLAFYLL